MTAQLSPRQRQVVAMVIAGKRVVDIAIALRCTEATVRAHIQAAAEDLPGPHPPMRRLLIYGPALLNESA